MDFAKLDTKTPAENGAFLHLKHPALGHLLHDADGKPVGVTVRGTESRSVRATLKSLEESKLRGQSDESGLGYVLALVIGFTGVERDGKPLKADSPEAIRWFFELSDGFVEQVVDFAKDRASFFPSVSTA